MQVKQRRKNLCFLGIHTFGDEPEKVGLFLNIAKLGFSWKLIMLKKISVAC
jgi:hypothetical protein